VKKEARLSVKALAEVEVGRDEEDLQSNNLSKDVGNNQKMKRLSWSHVAFWMKESDYGGVAVLKRF